jgi:hypothetical protein
VLCVAFQVQRLGATHGELPGLWLFGHSGSRSNRLRLSQTTILGDRASSLRRLPPRAGSPGSKGTLPETARALAPRSQAEGRSAKPRVGQRARAHSAWHSRTADHHKPGQKAQVRPGRPPLTPSGPAVAAGCSPLVTRVGEIGAHSEVAASSLDVRELPKSRDRENSGTLAGSVSTWALCLYHKAHLRYDSRHCNHVMLRPRTHENPRGSLRLAASASVSD